MVLWINRSPCKPRAACLIPCFSCLSYETFVKWPLSKRPKIVFQDLLILNAGQKYCRMLQREHLAILSTFIKLPLVIKTFVMYIFEWLFYTGFTVLFLKLSSPFLIQDLLYNCMSDRLIVHQSSNLHIKEIKVRCLSSYSKFLSRHPFHAILSCLQN